MNVAQTNIEIDINLKTLLVSGGVLLAIIAAVGGFYLYANTRAARPIPTELPTSVVQQAPFNVYAPDNPPDGFTLDPNSTSLADNVLLYAYTYQGKKLIVTNQALPKNFDASNFNPTKEIETRIGRAYIVDLETRTTAAIIAGNSLVFINAPQKIGINDLQAFIDSLRRAQ